MAFQLKHERSYLILAGVEKDRSARVVSMESTLFKDGIRRNRMTTIEKTIRSYREADSRTRIDLFMQHRELRKVFDTVEREEALREGDPDLSPGMERSGPGCDAGRNGGLGIRKARQGVPVVPVPAAPLLQVNGPSKGRG